MIRKLATMIATAVVAMALPAAAAGAADCSAPPPQPGDHVTLDPADFVAAVDNPYWPMAPGSRWVWREATSGGGGQKVVVTVKSRTKEVLGIATTVIHDRVTEDGELVEDTYDWYAQDVCGAVWYLGENTKEYRNGRVVSTEGSWEAGVDGAEAGVIVPADPQVGEVYRQEHYEGHAEDVARTLSVDEMVRVPYGAFDGVLLSRETTPLTPNYLEYKLFAPGVGPVLAITVSGGADREELVSFRAG